MSRQLRRHEPPELRGVLSFSVMPNESSPDEAGPLHVVIDDDGLSLRWLGDECESAVMRLTWREFRELHGWLKETGAAQRNLEYLREEIEGLRLALEIKGAKKGGTLVEFPVSGPVARERAT